MLLHEVADLWVYFIDFLSFGGLSPEVFSLLCGFSFPSRVTLVFGRVASLLVAHEALLVPHMLCSFTRRVIDFIYIHGIGVSGWSGSNGLSWQDVAVSPTWKFPELYHIPVELSCLVKPLFPFPTGLVLSFWEDSSSHHDGELVSYPSLKGIHQDAVKVNSAMHLSQSKGGGILVKVTVELVHACYSRGDPHFVFSIFPCRLYTPLSFLLQ